MYNPSLYNAVVMDAKMFSVRPFQILLVVALLLGLSPNSNRNMLSMQAMNIERSTNVRRLASPTHIVQGNSGEHRAPVPCCDAMGQPSLSCDFMASTSVCVAFYGGSVQVLYSVPILRSVYLSTLAPPPKI